MSRFKMMFLTLGANGMKLELLDVDRAGNPIVVPDADDPANVPSDNSAE